MDIASLLIQLASGALGGNAANSAKDTGLGTVGNTIAGALGGGVGGQILNAVLGLGGTAAASAVVEPGRRVCAAEAEHGIEDLAANAAAECPGDGVAHGAEARVFCGIGGVAAEGAPGELDEQRCDVHRRTFYAAEECSIAAALAAAEWRGRQPRATQ